MSFWDAVDYSNTRKVLVIPNITNSSNIDKDSFVDVIYNHITALQSRGEYFWHILMPIDNVSKKLNLPHIKQHQIDIPGDMMNQRSFPPETLLSKLRDIDYDIIYSHLPDWSQVGRYRKSMDTKIIGYLHWVEMKSCNGPDNRPGKPKTLWFPNEMLGILQMETCYLNTQDQKNRILTEAREMFNGDINIQLDKILRVWNLGVDKSKIIETPIDSTQNTIVFNHRAAAYKGYPKFLQLMEDYQKHRQDFNVWIPQLNGEPPYSWIDNSKVPKHEYYKRLRGCKVGIQMRQTNYGWSVAATDCMMNGTPMIFQESDCYREIQSDGLFFKTKKELFTLLDRMFDDDKFRRDCELKAIQRAEELSLNEDRMIDELHTKLYK